MKLHEYAAFDALGLADLVHRGEVTPTELADSKLDDPQWFGRNVTLLRPLDVRTENGLKRLWDEAKAGSAAPPK